LSVVVEGAGVIPASFLPWIAMSQITRIIEKNESTTTISGIGTSFDASKKSTIPLRYFTADEYVGILQGLWINYTVASGDPATLTMRITSDALGDEQIVTDTDSTMFGGITTASYGTVVYKIDLPVDIPSDEIYIFCKVDAGSINISKIVLTVER